MADTNYAEAANELARAGASREVISAELVKMGASVEVARRLSVAIKRERQLKRLVPYLIGGALLIAIAFLFLDWRVAIVLGLFWAIGIQRLYLSDKGKGNLP